MKRILSAMIFVGLLGASVAAQEMKKPQGKVAEKVGGAKTKEECKTKATKLAAESAEKNSNRSSEERIEVTVEITVKITATIKTVDDKTEKLQKSTDSRKGDKADDVAAKQKAQCDKVDKAAKKADAKSKKAKSELDERQELYEFLVELNDAVSDLDEIINLTLDLAIELEDEDLFNEAVELYVAAAELAEVLFDLGLIYGEMCWADWDEESREQQCEWLAYILVNWFAVDDEDAGDDE